MWMQGQNGLREQIGLRDMYILRDLKPLDPYNRGLGQAEAVADEIETYEYSIKYSKSFYYNDASSPLIFAADVNESRFGSSRRPFPSGTRASTMPISPPSSPVRM